MIFLEQDRFVCAGHSSFLQHGFFLFEPMCYQVAYMVSSVQCYAPQALSISDTHGDVTSTARMVPAHGYNVRAARIRLKRGGRLAITKRKKQSASSSRVPCSGVDAADGVDLVLPPQQRTIDTTTDSVSPLIFLPPELVAEIVSYVDFESAMVMSIALGKMHPVQAAMWRLHTPPFRVRVGPLTLWRGGVIPTMRDHVAAMVRRWPKIVWHVDVRLPAVSPGAVISCLARMFRPAHASLVVKTDQQVLTLSLDACPKYLCIVQSHHLQTIEFVAGSALPEVLCLRDNWELVSIRCTGPIDPKAFNVVSIRTCYTLTEISDVIRSNVSYGVRLTGTPVVATYNNAKYVTCAGVKLAGKEVLFPRAKNVCITGMVGDKCPRLDIGKTCPKVSRLLVRCINAFTVVIPASVTMVDMQHVRGKVQCEFTTPDRLQSLSTIYSLCRGAAVCTNLRELFVTSEWGMTQIDVVWLMHQPRKRWPHMKRIRLVCGGYLRGLEWTDEHIGLYPSVDVNTTPARYIATWQHDQLPRCIKAVIAAFTRR